jgi:1-acyl-sn-glycerol-3-phosphate acyltransferase
MNLLRSILFTLVFYLGCIPVVLASGVAALMGTNQIIFMANLWARWHRWCARWLLGISTRVEGALPQSPALVVIKHESMFETVEVLVQFDRPAVVFKKQLLKIPVWGFAAQRHGVIPIDREGGASAVRQMIAAGKSAIADGRPILLFPEGTRVAHGESPPLGSGMAGLYRLLGLPIVPIALDSGRVWPRGFIKRPGVVTMRVGETIPPGLSREEVEARVHRAINTLNG